MKTSYSCWIILVAAVAAVVHIGFFTIPAVAAGDTCNFPEDFDENCIIDITHPLRNNTPSFGSPTGSGNIINETFGQQTVTGTLRIGTHLGTHVDSPSHIYKELLEQGVTVNSLNLTTLIGPVLVVQTPNGKNITEAVLSDLHIPKGVKRVIFKTENTGRMLMDKQAFAGEYIGFTEDGAKYLVNNYADIKFVGIDYMSVARSKEVVAVHLLLLNQTRGIIPVENLKLDDVKPGPYTVYCLPLRLLAEAAPVRCILVKC